MFALQQSQVIDGIVRLGTFLATALMVGHLAA